MATSSRPICEAERSRDFDAILETFVEDCYLETHPGLRSEGKAATRLAYEGYFTAFPDLMPDDQGEAIGTDALVVWGTLRGTSGGDWVGVPPSGGSFAVPFANVTGFRDGLMAARASTSTWRRCASRPVSYLTPFGPAQWPEPELRRSQAETRRRS